MPISNGSVVFSHMVTPDEAFGNTDFSLTIALSEDEAQKLSDGGIKVKTYQKDEESEAIKQRSFKTKYKLKPTDIIDAEGNPFELTEELPRGSVVRIQWPARPPHPIHGVGAYISKLRILELAEPTGGAFEEGF